MKVNILKVALLIVAIAIVLALAYNKGWFGPTDEPRHCIIDTAGHYNCE
jgi:hypothetical protein